MDGASTATAPTDTAIPLESNEDCTVDCIVLSADARVLPSRATVLGAKIA